MRFAHDLLAFPAIVFALLGGALVVGLVAVLVLASFARTRAERRFGDPERVAALVTYDAAGRRAIKGALLVIGLALTLFALARPQFGHGTRLVPARARRRHRARFLEEHVRATSHRAASRAPKPKCRAWFSRCRERASERSPSPESRSAFR
ncbi:MAG: hypothetical protein U0235_16210 [Polyangiaceae bacterium]